MFVSVKEATKLTGKSATTIYRLCNKRINTEFVKKEDNRFLISKEFLLATYPPEEPEDLPIIEEEKPEMRFENVVDAPEVETAENAVVLEKTEPSTNHTDSVALKKDELEKGDIVEFNETAEKPYFQHIGSKEVLIGLFVSLLVVAVFIYLIALVSG